jgi:hypothetical protein
VTSSAATAAPTPRARTRHSTVPRATTDWLEVQERKKVIFQKMSEHFEKMLVKLFMKNVENFW